MIAHLSGTLLAKHATSVVVDVGGVGYEVTIPVTTFYDLGEVKAPVSLRIYTHVREDALQLFGFRTERERELFTLLISVSGIGPKSAVAMLSGMSADEIVTAIRTNNYARLTSIPGVGRKTAERLVIELRDKMAALSSPALEAEVAAGATAGAVASGDALREDTLAALVNLGYQKAAAERAITHATAEGGELSVELLLRRSLRQLSKG
jgi:Holliday junction DNA helicase RuvA